MDFSEEVPHSDLLIVRGTEPYNAEPSAAALVEFPITPEDLIYCRNHSPVLDLDESTYTVDIHGAEGTKSFTVEELRTNFARVEVVAALQVRPRPSILYVETLMDGLQCAGNRRKEMDEVKKVKGVLWNDGVIANARWAGVRVRDILNAAGTDTSSLNGWHVCFTSNVTPCQDDRDYGGSVPLTSVMDPDGDVLLAYDVSTHICSLDPRLLTLSARLDE